MSAWVDDTDWQLELVADDLNRQNKVGIVRDYDGHLVVPSESVGEQHRREIYV